MLGPCSVLAQNMILSMNLDFAVSNTQECYRRKERPISGKGEH